MLFHLNSNSILCFSLLCNKPFKLGCKTIAILFCSWIFVWLGQVWMVCLCSRMSGSSSEKVPKNGRWFESLSVGIMWWFLHPQVWWLEWVIQRLGLLLGCQSMASSCGSGLMVRQLDLRGSIWKESTVWEWGRSFKISSKLGSEITQWHLHDIVFITSESQKLAWVSGRAIKIFL